MSKEKNVLGKSVSGKRCIREMYKKQNVLGTSIVGKVFHEIPYKFAVPLHARIWSSSSGLRGTLFFLGFTWTQNRPNILGASRRNVFKIVQERY